MILKPIAMPVRFHTTQSSLFSYIITDSNLSTDILHKNISHSLKLTRQEDEMFTVQSDTLLFLSAVNNYCTLMSASIRIPVAGIYSSQVAKPD